MIRFGKYGKQFEDSEPQDSSLYRRDKQDRNLLRRARHLSIKEVVMLDTSESEMNVPQLKEGKYAKLRAHTGNNVI